MMLEEVSMLHLIEKRGHGGEEMPKQAAHIALVA